jgi:hypothetical protein
MKNTDISIPKIYIKAINPGYTVDGKSNVGEMIEIGFLKDSPDEVVSLAGVSLGYTNSSGNTTELAKFSEYIKATGESILLKLASAEDAEQANFNYTKTLAMQGGLTLFLNDEVMDMVCWTGKEDCLKAFKSSKPTTLVRNLETGEFEHLEEYAPIYDENAIINEEPIDGMGAVEPQCRGLRFSEIFSFYEDMQTEQFVEIYNDSAEQILMDGCMIKYKNRIYPLNGVLKPEGYYVRLATDFSLTKNPNNVNLLEIIDVDGSIAHRIEYPNGQRKGASYAFIGYDDKGAEIWRVTYAVTPGEPNAYQEFKSCEEGKVINEATGNCVKIAAAPAEKVCAEGQYLNPLTGRCRKIETVSVKICKEGYYLNEETGRCKKIITNTGASFALDDAEYKEETSFAAIYAVIGVILVALGYIVYEFRRELVKIFRKAFQRVRQKRHRGTGHH